MSEQVNWPAATEAVQQATKILIVTHVSPDGDAIGSLLGLANALREMDKKVTTVVDGGVPDNLDFLPGAGGVQGKLKRGKWDLMISVDASDEPRTGLAGEYGRAHSPKVINLDHHPTNVWFGDIFIVVPTAVSATEIVYDWLVYMQHPISKRIAEPLLAGLVTDTLGFRTNNVTARTLEIAQALIKAGASLSDIVARALVSKPYNTIELWKQSLASVTMNETIISANVTQADLKQARIGEATDRGLVGLLVSVDEAKIAVVFKELADGRVELSMRSKPGYDVSGVALGLGGGGHKQAAGATIDGPLDAARERVLALLHAIQPDQPA
ncbi:MAG: bifunctional oligoribonuclease/PAP phosphatase NrnA [Anaerolineaceae bacterium]|nr:bifunctional oligoribonuclease/PAP phosphatase NrnA [Anaerolineaceae bacterium]